jgi:hypothetical protein
MPLRPGRFFANQTDYSSFVNSMADEMDKQLNDLMLLDHLPPLKTDPNDREVRDRRRLFVAIARGVAIHLRDHHDAFQITVPILGNPVVTPAIQVDLT